MSRLYAELEVAMAAARAGAEEAMRRFRGTYASRRKADGTWVTEADEASERAVRAVLAEAFPDHNLHGEEEGLAVRDPDAPTWVIDPIDATANYVSGIPVWATLVGLRVAGEAVVGVVCAPALGEEYAASRGGGATCNGETIAVERVERVEEAQVLFADAGLLLDRVPGFASLVARASRDRGLGDFWGHVLVARGAAHVMVEAGALSLWDVTALEPIVAESGGRLTDLRGATWSGSGPVLTSCGGPLHDEVVSLLAAR
jgi:histidinol-phosphatase